MRWRNDCFPALVLERCVPNFERRRFAIITKHVQRCRIEEEVFAITRRQVNPAGGQNAKDMSVRKQRDVSIHSANLRNDPVGASADF